MQTQTSLFTISIATLLSTLSSAGCVAIADDDVSTAETELRAKPPVPNPGCGVDENGEPLPCPEDPGGGGGPSNPPPPPPPSPGPNLIATSPSGTVSCTGVRNAERTIMTATVRNIGEVSAPATYALVTIEQSMTWLAVPPLSPGALSSFQIVIPPQLWGTEYASYVTVDATSIVAETNETDNVGQCSYLR